MEHADLTNGVVESSTSTAADRKSMRRMVLGASLGTIFEWYDYFLYIALAVFFGHVFFPQASATAGLLASLATFGVGFVVRPFGAILFGHVGDRFGRKYTFIFTIILMGCSTAAIGFLPGFQQIGWAAPVILVLLRLLQGLSVGGEFGGAATYVAEHADDRHRGLQTSWVQTTVFFGEAFALIAVLCCRLTMSNQSFVQWGWRVPFFISLLLLAASVYIRLRLDESPAFEKMQRAGKLSRAPVRETFGSSNLRPFLVAVLLCIGQVVVGYASSIYPFIFMLAVLKLNPITANVLFTAALLISVPLMVFSGWLSDKLGRKWIILGGCLLAAGSYFPVLHGLTHYANPALETFERTTAVSVAASDCHLHFFVIPGTKLSACDKAKDFLMRRGVNYVSLPSIANNTLETRIGGQLLHGFDPKRYTAALRSAGYPAHADPARVNGPMIVLLLVVLSFFSALTFGPLGAFLVEQFPTRIRYTSVSAAYNFGAGWVGGLTPFIVSALSISAGNIYFGFWFPVIVSIVVFVLGAVLVREGKTSPIREF